MRTGSLIASLAVAGTLAVSPASSASIAPAALSQASPSQASQSPVTISSGTVATGTAAQAAGSPARVAVSVATLWVSPSSPRPLDALAIANPADPARWLRGLTTSQRRGLNGRVESQVLFGRAVTVLQRRGAWSQVVVPDQPSPKSPLGYPGWIPTAQLTTAASVQTGLEAVVTRRTTGAYRDAARTRRVLRLSYGTRLPATGRSGTSVSVTGPTGETLWLPAKRVRLVTPGGPARRPTRAAVVAEARRFRGLPYLWGGTSGFGFDCSGLTQAVYAQLGITIPRDATPQFAAGRPVRTLSGLRRGDLVFFRNAAGTLHHVGIYAGRGRMIHSPRTGQPVAYASIRTGLWRREFAGGRRYL